MKLIACVNASGFLDFKAPKTDLQRFQALTVGGVCVVGRTTWETLPPAAKRNRKWIVVTSEARLKDIDYTVTPERADRTLNSGGNLNTWLCGGAKTYELLYRCCDMIYLSRCCGDSGKVAFPAHILEELAGSRWERIVKQDHIDHTFEIFKWK